MHRQMMPKHRTPLRTPLSFVAVCLLMSILLLGCQPEPTASDAADRRATRLVYYSWAGTSPGGGLTFTSLIATEVDFDEGRARNLYATASAPDPMLPYLRGEVQARLDERPWKDLSLGQLDRLTGLVHDWLATCPPETYNIPRGLGREDGHAEVMTVTMDSGEQHVTTANPRGGSSPSDPLAPPPQWGQLVNGLRQLQGPKADLQPLGSPTSGEGAQSQSLARQIDAPRRIVTTRPWEPSTDGAELRVMRGMAPWRVVTKGDKYKLVVGSRTFLTVPQGLQQPSKQLPVSYEGKLYDSVWENSVRATPDLKHIAYLARDGNKQFVVVDHREEPAFDGIAYDTIRLSDDGSRVAYMVNQRTSRNWVADGRLLPESTFLRELAFSPDGKRLAYHITTDAGQTRLCVDGKVAITYDKASIEHLTFSPDSKRVLYVLAQPESQYRAVIDGQIGPAFEKIKWNYPGWQQVFFFSPDHTRVAYVGQQQGKDILVVDQSPGEPLEDAQVLGIKFSPDSKQLAAMAGRPGQKWFLVADGTRTTPRGHVIFNSITFSPDGRYLAYMTSTDGGWTVVVNDSPGAVYERLASAERQPLRFVAADRLQYGAAKGAEVITIEERLVSDRREHVLQGITPEGFRSVVQAYLDKQTGVCSLRADGMILRHELKLDGRHFEFLDAWRYDTGTKRWHRLESPGRKVVQITADPKRAVFGSHTDQVLIEVTDRPGLYWMRWLEEGKLLQMPVLCGPVMPQDYKVAPPPKGMVVAGMPYEDRAEGIYIEDPREFFLANPPSSTLPATMPAAD